MNNQQIASLAAFQTMQLNELAKRRYQALLGNHPNMNSMHAVAMSNMINNIRLKNYYQQAQMAFGSNGYPKNQILGKREQPSPLNSENTANINHIRTQMMEKAEQTNMRYAMALNNQRRQSQPSTAQDTTNQKKKIFTIERTVRRKRPSKQIFKIIQTKPRPFITKKSIAIIRRPLPIEPKVVIQSEVSIQEMSINKQVSLKADTIVEKETSTVSEDLTEKDSISMAIDPITPKVKNEVFEVDKSANSTPENDQSLENNEVHNIQTTIGLLNNDEFKKIDCDYFIKLHVEEDHEYDDLVEDSNWE